MNEQSGGCQACGRGTGDGWALCQSCRREYATQIHRLRMNLQELHALALREYRLAEHGSGGDGFAPTPIDLSAADLEAEAQRAISGIAAKVSVWGDWRHMLRRLPQRLPQLCRAPGAGHDLQQVTRLNQRIGNRVERRRVKPFVGPCPACGRNVEADPDEHGTVCACGRWLDLDALRECTNERWARQHTTQTPAGAARWVEEQTGIKVGRNAVSDAIRRGRLDAVKLEGGYYEFAIGSLLRFAERKTQ